MRLYDFSGCELVEEIGEQIRAFNFRAEQLGVSISAKKREGTIHVFEGFQNIIVPDQVITSINSIDWKNVNFHEELSQSIPYYKNIPEGASLSKLVELSGGLSKSLLRIQAVDRYLYKDSWGLSDEEEDKRIIHSYIHSIYDGLQVIKTAVNIKHKHRKPSSPQDFCVLCWKRVRHNQKEVADYEKKRRESNYYCPEHHPTRATDGYLKAIRSLIKAVKDERPKFKCDLERLKSGQISSESRAAMFNKWTISFAPKSKLLTGRMADDIEWDILAEILIHQAKINYKNVHVKIASSLKDRENWQLWFFNGLLDSLDDTKDKSERLMWQTTDVKNWRIFEWRKYGWTVILHLFRRYEAYYYISNRSRPRGPKSQENRPLTPLQKRIKLALDEYVNQGLKPSVKRIAEELGVAPKTVYQLKNKLEL